MQDVLRAVQRSQVKADTEETPFRRKFLQKNSLATITPEKVGQKGSELEKEGCCNHMGKYQNRDEAF